MSNIRAKLLYLVWAFVCTDAFSTERVDICQYLRNKTPPRLVFDLRSKGISNEARVGIGNIQPELSANGEFMAIALFDGVRIYSVSSGLLVGKIPATDSNQVLNTIEFFGNDVFRMTGVNYNWARLYSFKENKVIGFETETKERKDIGTGILLSYTENADPRVSGADYIHTQKNQSIQVTERGGRVVAEINLGPAINEIATARFLPNEQLLYVRTSGFIQQNRGYKELSAIASKRPLQPLHFLLPVPAMQGKKASSEIRAKFSEKYLLNMSTPPFELNFSRSELSAEAQTSYRELYRIRNLLSQASVLKAFFSKRGDKIIMPYSIGDSTYVEQRVLVHKTDSGKKIAEFRFSGSTVTSAKFSPSEKFIAFGLGGGKHGMNGLAEPNTQGEWRPETIEGHSRPYLLPNIVVFDMENPKQPIYVGQTERATTSIAWRSDRELLFSQQKGEVYSVLVGKKNRD